MGPLEKRWQWSPLTTVIFPWQFASGSRLATIPAPRKAHRRARKSKLVLFLFYTDEQLQSFVPGRLIQIPVIQILIRLFCPSSCLLYLLFIVHSL